MYLVLFHYICLCYIVSVFNILLSNIIIIILKSIIAKQNSICFLFSFIILEQNVIVLQSGGGGFLSGTSVSEAGLTQGDYVDGGLCFHAPSPPNQGEVVYVIFLNV